MHNGGVHNGLTIGETLTRLVAADGSSLGFVQDSEVSTYARTLLDDANEAAFKATLNAEANVDFAAHLSTMRVLFTLIGADLNVTTDQSFTKVGSFTNYVIVTMAVTNFSGSGNTAVGGIYTEAAKGGTAMVANTQNYAASTGAGGATVLTLTSAAAGSGRSVNTVTPILSLTTPQGGALTADFYALGIPLT